MQAYCMKCRTKKEMSNPKDDQNEEWQASHTGHLPQVRHQDVPHRQGIIACTNRK